MITMTWSQSIAFWSAMIADINTIITEMTSVWTSCGDEPDALEQIYLTLTETARMCQAMLSIFA
jgi:hypothetical protein